MKKLLAIIILFGTTTGMGALGKTASVPDELYFPIKTNTKDIAYWFAEEGSISDKVKVYKINSDYAKYPFLAKPVFNLCILLSKIEKSILKDLPADLKDFLDTLTSLATSIPKEIPFPENKLLSPSLLEVAPLSNGKTLNASTLFNYLIQLDNYLKQSDFKSIFSTLLATSNTIVEILKNDAQTVHTINQIRIIIGNKGQQPSRTFYDIDISELTPEQFPNLKVLNLYNAYQINTLLNIPYNSTITTITVPSNQTEIAQKLKKQLNDAKNPAITSPKPIASTSKEIPISPTFIPPAAEPKPEEPIKPATNPTPIISTAPVSITPTPAPSYWQRWQNWIQQNKARLAIGGTAAIGVSAGAYYLWRNPERFNQVKAWFNWSKK